MKMRMLTIEITSQISVFLAGSPPFFLILVRIIVSRIIMSLRRWWHSRLDVGCAVSQASALRRLARGCHLSGVSFVGTPRIFFVGAGCCRRAGAARSCFTQLRKRDTLHAQPALVLAHGGYASSNKEKSKRQLAASKSKRTPVKTVIITHRNLGAERMHLQMIDSPARTIACLHVTAPVGLRR